MRHFQMSVTVGRASASIDETIAPLINRLWKLKIATSASCEDNDDSGMVWIQFPSYRSARRFTHWIASAVSFYHWQSDGQMGHGNGRISAHYGVRFPKDELPAVLRAFGIRKGR